MGCYNNETLKKLSGNTYVGRYKDERIELLITNHGNIRVNNGKVRYDYHTIRERLGTGFAKMVNTHTGRTLRAEANDMYVSKKSYKKAPVKSTPTCIVAPTHSRDLFDGVLAASVTLRKVREMGSMKFTDISRYINAVMRKSNKGQIGSDQMRFMLKKLVSDKHLTYDSEFDTYHIG